MHVAVSRLTGIINTIYAQRIRPVRKVTQIECVSKRNISEKRRVRSHSATIQNSMHKCLCLALIFLTMRLHIRMR